MTRLVKMMAVAMLGLTAVNAQAGTFSLSPTITYLNPAFEPVAPPAPNTNPGVPYVLQVDVTVEVLALNAGEAGFGNTAFNIGLTGPLAEAGVGWQSNGQTVDSNGALPGGIVPLWATNGDFGADTTDLQGILVSIAPGVTGANDPRRKVGQAGGLAGFLGTVFLNWDGTQGGIITLSNILLSTNTSTGLLIDSGSLPDIEVVVGNLVPEPTSLALLGSCFAGLLLRRRVA